MPTPPEEERFILCIDGGGMRGIIPSIVLQKYSQMLRLSYDKPFWSAFDLIAGTSTGGLLVAALSFSSTLPQKGEGTAEELESSVLESIYTDYRHIIFPRPRSGKTFKLLSQIVNSKYSEKPLEKLLKKWFGETTLKEAKVPVLIMGYNVTEGVPFPMTSSKDPDMKLWQACRATSAAPTYFTPQKIDSSLIVDGGVIANNPVLYAYREAKELYPHCKCFHILSLSTAGSYYKMEENESSGLVSWLEPMQKIYSTSQKQVAEDTIKAIDNVEYVRIHRNLDDEIKMDDISPAAISALKENGEKTVEENSELLSVFAQIQGDYKNASTTG